MSRVLPLLGLTLSLAPLATVVEVEPNDTVATAQRVALDDTVTASINVAGDADYYVFDVPANTYLALEVIAQRAGSPLNSFLELFGADGESVIGTNNDAYGRDSRIRIDIEAAGRYYARVSDVVDAGGPAYTYRFVVGQFLPGLGDPTRRLPPALPSAWAAAAAPGGPLYVADPLTGRLFAIVHSAEIFSFVANLGEPLDLVVDGNRDVILVGNDAQNRPYIKRITPNAVQSDFATGTVDPVSVTIGPDGDVWVADPRAGVLRRYDATGASRGTVALTGVRGLLLDLAFSPSGVLHVSNFDDTIYALIDNRFVPVLTSTFLSGIAFDRDGSLYIATIDRGVILYDPLYRPVNIPFAISGLGVLSNLVFLRDANGAMTTRIVALDFQAGRLFELNAAGVRAPGFRIGIDFMTIATDSLRRASLGAVYADTLRVQGVTEPLTWRITSGSLPTGLTLSTTGVISGVPEINGTFAIGVRAEAPGRVGVKNFTLTVGRPVVDAASAANQLMGVPGAVTADVARFLDLQGNRNGRYDVGDLQLFLRSRSAVTTQGTQRGNDRKEVKR